MSPKRRTQAERAMETQGKLIAAALGVLREKGYAGFRIADVPGAAGVSRGAQSHHFPTKLELLLATFEWLYEQITERSRARLAKLKPEDDVIQQMLDDAAEFFLDDDFSISLDLIVAADRDPALREGIQRTVERNRFVVEDMWLGVLVSRGLSRDDAEDILWLIFNSVRGLAVRSLWQKDKERFERVRNSTLEIARERYAKFKRGGGGSGGGGSRFVGHVEPKGKYPLISMVRAGSWCEACEPYDIKDIDEWYDSDVNLLGNGFWLKVEGDSMTSPVGQSIPEGHMVLVDTGREPVNGSLVVAKLTDANEATFKKLVIDGGQKYLKGLNPSWPMTPINGNCKIIGVVVEARVKFV